jgi:hypothetical protein
MQPKRSHIFKIKVCKMTKTTFKALALSLALIGNSNIIFAGDSAPREDQSGQQLNLNNQSETIHNLKARNTFVLAAVAEKLAAGVVKKINLRNIAASFTEKAQNVNVPEWIFEIPAIIGRNVAKHYVGQHINHINDHKDDKNSLTPEEIKQERYANLEADLITEVIERQYEGRAFDSTFFVDKTAQSLITHSELPKAIKLLTAFFDSKVYTDLFTLNFQRVAERINATKGIGALILPRISKTLLDTIYPTDSKLVENILSEILFYGFRMHVKPRTDKLTCVIKEQLVNGTNLIKGKLFKDEAAQAATSEVIAQEIISEENAVAATA